MKFELDQPTVDNIKILKKYLKYNNYPGCDFSAANNILWSKFYGTKYTIIDDMLVYVSFDENKEIAAFSFPIGEHDPRESFDKIINYFHESEKEVKIILVNEKVFQLVESWYPDEFAITYNRDDMDYLYERKTLEELKGKKLHAKRNHIHRFENAYPDYSYERISADNIHECAELANNWEEENNDEHSDSKSFELEILEYALHNMSELELIGGLIRADGRVVAFTIGERLTKDTFVIHFEKAYANIQGSYAIINREFVRHELSDYKYINREEDMGIPGLRHAKTSYQPIKLVKKGVITRIR